MTTTEPFPSFVAGAPVATTPLTGTEIMPIIQGGATRQIPVLSSGRIYAPGGITLNVSPSGSDVTGNVSNTFATPYAALLYSQTHLDGGGGGITINMAPGTYKAANRFASKSVVEFFPYGGPVTAVLFNGASPSSVIWDVGVNGDGGFFSFGSGCSFQFQNFTILQSTIGGKYNGAITQYGASTVSFNNMIFGAMTGAHISLGNEAKASGATYTVNGNADLHLLLDDSNTSFQLGATTVTLNSPAFGTAFVYAKSGGNFTSAGTTFAGVGTTGKRFKIFEGGILGIYDGSGNPLGLTALPGNAAGISDGTGVYNGLILGNGGKLVSALATGIPAGTRDFVTDATATTFASTVAGSGGNKVPVVFDGTNWIIG